MLRERFTIVRVAAALALTAMLAACGAIPENGRPRSATYRPPAPQFNLPPQTSFARCTANLQGAAISFQQVADRNDGGGCELINTVKLMNFGTPATNLGPMTCQLASNFAAWARYAIAPAARLYLGAEVVRIETYGTYACRNVVGNPQIAGKRSEHAHANAVDVSAFVLSDGRRVSIENNWNDSGPAGLFLHVIHDSACRRFNTVLSPDFNRAHYNHFHLDMGGRAGACH